MKGVVSGDSKEDSAMVDGDAEVGSKVLGKHNFFLVVGNCVAFKRKWTVIIFIWYTWTKDIFPQNLSSIGWAVLATNMLQKERQTSY